MELLEAIATGGFWTISKKLVEHLYLHLQHSERKSSATTAIQAALYYSDIASAMNYHKTTEIYRTENVITEHTFLSRKIQKNCRDLLTELNLIRVIRKVPSGHHVSKLHFVYDEVCSRNLEAILSDSIVQKYPKGTIKSTQKYQQ